MGISKRIKDDVFYLVNKYKTRNPFELADALGIIVVKAPLKDGLNGCYHEEFGFQFIYVNSDLCEQQQLIVASHELGHSRLHKGQNILFLNNNTLNAKGKFERQANMYAAELLISDDCISDYIHIDNCTLENISQYACVSYELVDFKINYLSK